MSSVVVYWDNIDSSMIKSIKFEQTGTDPTKAGELIILFQSGDSYEYEGFTMIDLLNMMEADSVGIYFNNHVKNKYHVKKRQYL